MTKYKDSKRYVPIYIYIYMYVLCMRIKIQSAMSRI